jgi:small-conductance mechanosensitive channel
MESLLAQIPVSHLVQTLIGVGVIVIATMVASLVLRPIVFRIIGHLTRQTSTTLDDQLLKVTRGSLSLLIAVLGASVLFQFVENRYPQYMGEDLMRLVDGAIFGAGILLVAVLMVKVVGTILQWYGREVSGRSEKSFGHEFVPLLDRTVKIVVILLALLIVLDNFGIDIKGMIAVLGIGSLAVALAAQDTLANMIGGFTIMIDRPFRVGDMVKLADGSRVVVHEIGIRSTKFLTFDHTLEIVPNAELIKSTVHNITYPAPRVRVVIDVGVSYDSDIARVREAMLDEAAQHPNVLSDPDPKCYFMNFGDSSLDVSLRCQVKRPEDHRATSSQLREQVLNRFRTEGIEIPFPQRVITMVRGESEEADG